METEIVLLTAIGAVIIAGLYIVLFSLVKEPERQTVNALIIAGAGATYWSNGLGYFEFPLGIIMLYLAYRGLKNYKFLALGWLVHTFYDLLHHWYGEPIVPMAATSSLGCAICDPILAFWLFFDAPSVFRWRFIFSKKQN